MQNSIWLYRLFDVAEEIQLEVVEKILAQGKPTSRMRLSRIRPKSIQFKNPPVAVELEESQIKIKQQDFRTRFITRIYDLGVICIIMRILLPDGTAFEEIKKLAFELYNTKEIEFIFREQLDKVRKTLSPALIKEEYNEFIQDFTIFYFQEWQDKWDPLPLLLAEDGPVSPQVRRETLQHSFSYSPQDLTIITWDSALVYDSTGSTDIPDLLEFANSQLLELRYYDSLLTREMEKMYNAIEDAEAGKRFLRLRHYRQIMNWLMELVIDISEIIERIDNSLKVTEDVFYARIYGTALSIFRTKAWTESIQRKVSLIQQSYSMLSNEIINQRSMWLEVAIVFLFILEVVLGVLGFLR